MQRKSLHEDKSKTASGPAFGGGFGPRRRQPEFWASAAARCAACCRADCGPGFGTGAGTGGRLSGGASVCVQQSAGLGPESGSGCWSAGQGKRLAGLAIFAGRPTFGRAAEFGFVLSVPGANGFGVVVAAARSAASSLADGVGAAPGAAPRAAERRHLAAAGIGRLQRGQSPLRESAGLLCDWQLVSTPAEPARGSGGCASTGDPLPAWPLESRPVHVGQRSGGAAGIGLGGRDPRVGGAESAASPLRASGPDGRSRVPLRHVGQCGQRADPGQHRPRVCAAARAPERTGCLGVVLGPGGVLLPEHHGFADVEHDPQFGFSRDLAGCRPPADRRDRGQRRWDADVHGGSIGSAGAGGLSGRDGGHGHAGRLCLRELQSAPRRRRQCRDCGFICSQTAGPDGGRRLDERNGDQRVPGVAATLCVVRGGRQRGADRSSGVRPQLQPLGSRGDVPLDGAALRVARLPRATLSTVAGLRDVVADPAASNGSDGHLADD